MIIVTGTVAYDYIMDFPGSFGDHILPDQIHKINLSFMVDKFARRRGGTAGNLSYSLRLLDTRYKLFTVAGKDFQEYEKAFKTLGISTENVQIDKRNYTSTGFAMTDKKDNQIWGYFFGASEKIRNLKLGRVAKKNDLIVIGSSGPQGSMSFIKQCVRFSFSYMFDLGFTVTQVKSEDLEFGIRHASFVIGNDYEMTFARKKLKNWRRVFEKKVVVTTLGEKGAIIEERGKIYEIRPVKPKKVLDPTGAGDAWRAGFLAGVERKFNLQVCGQMGSTAASYAIENYGSQEHSFTKKEFEERYRQNFGSLIKL